MDAGARDNSSFPLALARWIRIDVLGGEQSVGSDKNSRYWPKQDRLMDQSPYRRRIRGIRDFRKPARVPLLVAPRCTSEDVMTVVCNLARSRRSGMDASRGASAARTSRYYPCA